VIDQCIKSEVSNNRACPLRRYERRNAKYRIYVSVSYSFYRAMLCIRGTSHGPVSVCLCLSVSVSVCLSVTSRSSTKTAKRRITQTISHDSPGTLVFGSQRSPRNSTGITPCGGAKYRWGGSKSATFDKCRLYLENGTR